MGRDSVLFKHLTQVDFEEIRQKGTPAAKEVIDRVAEAGLEYFLGGPHVLYKDAVKEFFNTATISDDKITATVCGTEIELTEESVAESLRLPTAGQDATADIEIKTFEAVCQILSATKEPIKVSEGTKVNWAKAVFHNLMDMVKPDSVRSWGYAVPLGKIFLHHNLKIGPGVIIPSRSLIRAKQFLEMKKPAPGSTGGRKKTAGKKAAPAKEKVESKGKEKIIFSEPPQPTEEEESASTSERTGSEKTDDEEQSGQSPDNASTGANPETTEGGEEGGEEGGAEGSKEISNEEEEEDEEAEADRIALKLLKGTEQRAEKIGEIYLEWHEHRFGKRYRDILPGYTDEECLQRLKEVEDVVMDLTKSDTIEEVLHRTYLLRPRAQLRKLTIRIRKITARFEEVASEDTLTPLVLERLEKARGELIQEIDRLEAKYGQREIPHYTAPQIDRSPAHSPTPPRENPATDDTDERTDAPLTGQSPQKQPEVSEPGVTKEWVESRIQEFEDSTVTLLEEKFQRTVSSALQFANTTRQLLIRTEDRFSEIDEDQQEEAVLRSKHLMRTIILEDTTSEIKENFARLERETDERLTEVTKDLVGITLDRVSDLEKKNEGLEAELKALTAQVAELLNVKMNADAGAVEADARAAKKVQDALDDEARKEKEPPQHPEEEEAERIRRVGAKFPGFAKTVAAQAAKDAERLERERRRLEGFAADNKKKKAASSVSVPTKRKREPSKKVQIADLLNEVTETIIESIPQQATQVEEEDEEHLQPRSTRQRVTESANRPQPVKKKRNKKFMTSYDFSDSE
ncbi:myosin heavy chain, clone 203-like [Impatiens glandulifera]|uniref:myosin heavy chain, clone 203-like n=1 Tax=Impatiens glandulifera TaxID=253017 RepID=UPI001FB04DF5|nr:myosin heavy chain, clone 203-like [Impatiens glandulifera]